MKKRTLALAASLCLLAAGGARADGSARAAPAVDPPIIWSGFYLGAGGGAGAVVHDVSVDVPGVVNILRFDGVGGEGGFGTVVAGYDHQVSRYFVLGVFADYDFSRISSDLSILNGAFTASLEHKNSWSVGGRAGILTSPSTLWFATAGYSQAQFDLSSSAGSLDLPDFKGYFVGAGVESKFLNGWSLRAEYRFTQFDREFGVLDPSRHRHRRRAVDAHRTHRAGLQARPARSGARTAEVER